jgi:hypothetical protein
MIILSSERLDLLFSFVSLLILALLAFKAARSRTTRGTYVARMKRLIGMQMPLSMKLCMQREANLSKMVAIQLIRKVEPRRDGIIKGRYARLEKESGAARTRRAPNRRR